MMTETLVQQGQALLDAFNRRDLSRWRQQLAPDFTASYPGLRDCRDAEAAYAFNAPFLAAFSDLQFQIRLATAAGDQLIYLLTARGTHDGPLVSPAGTLPPSGRTGSVDGVLVTTVRNGRIVREETYWNVPDLLALIG
jgi:steroid delta-isomerase-like uncharacterized protein